MSKNLVLHELTGSPNSVKVRIALGYKGLDYDRKPLPLDGYPGDRGAVARLSRQPRLPVLEHGGTLIFDSAAIMRYLEANFPDTPRLFVDDFAEHAEIERWELFAKTMLSEPIGMLFGQAFSPEPDAGEIDKANQLINQRTGAIEDRLNTSSFLVGDHVTVADITCAAPLYLTDMSEATAADHPIARFFHQHCKLGPGRDKTRTWVRKVMAYDPIKGKR